MLRLVALLLLAICLPVQALARKSYPVGTAFEYAWVPNAAELRPGGVVHSKKNPEIFSRAFQGSPLYVAHHQAIQAYLESNRDGTPSQTQGFVSGTKYRRNYWVKYLGRGKGRNISKFQVFYDVDVSGGGYTDRQARQLELIAGTDFGISFERCWNLMWLFETSPARRKPIAKTPEINWSPPTGTVTITPPVLPKAKPVEPPVSLEAEAQYEDVTPMTQPPSVTRPRRRRVEINIQPGGSNYRAVAPGSRTSETIGSFGIFGQSTGHKTSCSCFRCQFRPQPRPAHRPGGFRPPLGGQPRGDSGLGTQPGGNTPPGL